jgi:dolichol-phosphate mannosyltransferase
VSSRRGLGAKGLVSWLFLAVRIVAGVSALSKLARAARPLPPLASTSADPHRADTNRCESGSITVVIPARNEALRLAPCLELLRSDPSVAEVIVVDDHSTDDTAGLARSYGARVVAAQALPTGWAGKCWAVQQGVQAATTEWVVTLDADTEPAVGLAAALIHRAQANGLDLLTVSGRFRCSDGLLQALHPSLLTTLVYRYGPPGAAHRLPRNRSARTERLLANGQCMAFRRADFLAEGGFRPVSSSLVEDVALIRHWARAGRSVGFLDASSLLTVTMHTDAADAWRGWGRSLPLGGVAGPSEQATGLAVVWFAQALPLVRLLLGRGDIFDRVLLLARLGTLAGTRRAYDHPSASYWLSPLADIPVALRLTQSTLRPERTWRGRTYA